MSGYALYVAAAWIFGVAPGEIAFEAARLSTLPGVWERAETIVRIDDSTLLIGSRSASEGPAGLLVIDLDALAVGEVEQAIIGRAESVGWPRNALRGATGLRVLTEGESGARQMVVFDSASGSVGIEAVDPTALWILPDSNPAGHGLIDFLAEQRFGLHVATTAAVVSGELALVRLAGPGGVQADDFAVFVTTNFEPMGLFDTLSLGPVAPFAQRGGFIYLEAGIPMVAWCEGSSCETGVVRVRTDSHPIETIDIRSDVRRIALCTPSELYFYEGTPPSENIILLGRADRVGGCRALAVVDDRRVLVVTAVGAELIEFIEEDRS